METEVLKFCKNSSLEEMIKFCDQLYDFHNFDQLTIDFSPMGRVEPFTLLYTAQAIRDFKRANSNTEVLIRNYGSKAYAENMGFFKTILSEEYNSMPKSTGNKSFQPITILLSEDIQTEASERWKKQQEVIENKAEILADILSRQLNKEIIKTLTYSITEIMRNIIEHSDSKFIMYCAQYWPSYKKVEIAILDSGIGLKNSLNKNPYYSDIDNCRDSIQLAIMPGISSTNYKGAIIDKDDPWHNSGFGLYMTSRLCRNGGEFVIATGDHCLAQDESGKFDYAMKHFFDGTAVKMVLNVDAITSLSDMLNKFRVEGYKIAKGIKNLGVIDGPVASQLLTRDFRPN